MLLPRLYREQRKSCVLLVFFTLVSHFIPYSSTFLAIQPHPPLFSLILRRSLEMVAFGSVPLHYKYCPYGTKKLIH
jgi:hypothetical protein